MQLELEFEFRAGHVSRGTGAGANGAIRLIDC